MCGDLTMLAVRICGCLVLVGIFLHFDHHRSSVQAAGSHRINAIGKDLLSRNRSFCSGQICETMPVSSRIFRGKCSGLKRICHHQCIDIGGSYYKCTCRHGYKLLSNQRSCWKDIIHTVTPRRQTTLGASRGHKHGIGPVRLTSAPNSTYRRRADDTFLQKFHRSRLSLPRRYQGLKQRFPKVPSRSSGSPKRLKLPMRSIQQKHVVTSSPGQHKTPRSQTGSGLGLGSISSNRPATHRQPTSKRVSLLSGQQLRKDRSKASRLSMYRNWIKNKRKSGSPTIVSKKFRIWQEKGGSQQRKNKNESQTKLFSSGKSHRSQSEKTTDYRSIPKSTRYPGQMFKSRKHTSAVPAVERHNMNYKKQFSYKVWLDKVKTETKYKLVNSMQADQPRVKSVDDLRTTSAKDGLSSSSSSSSWIPSSYSPPSVAPATTAAVASLDMTKTRKIKFAKRPVLLKPLGTLLTQAQTFSSDAPQKSKAITVPVTRKSMPSNDAISTETKTKTTTFEPMNVEKVNTDRDNPNKTEAQTLSEHEGANKIKGVNSSQVAVNTESEIPGLRERFRNQNKLFLRQKMLSSMREQFLDPRMAALLNRLRQQKQRQLQRGTVTQHGVFLSPRPQLLSSSSSSPSSAISAISSSPPTTVAATTETTTKGTEPYLQEQSQASVISPASSLAPQLPYSFSLTPLLSATSSSTTQTMIPVTSIPAKSIQTLKLLPDDLGAEENSTQHSASDKQYSRTEIPPLQARQNLSSTVKPKVTQPRREIDTDSRTGRIDNKGPIVDQAVNHTRKSWTHPDPAKRTKDHISNQKRRRRVYEPSTFEEEGEEEKEKPSPSSSSQSLDVSRSTTSQLEQSRARRLLRFGQSELMPLLPSDGSRHQPADVMALTSIRDQSVQRVDQITHEEERPYYRRGISELQAGGIGSSPITYKKPVPWKQSNSAERRAHDSREESSDWTRFPAATPPSANSKVYCGGGLCLSGSSLNSSPAATRDVPRRGQAPSVIRCPSGSRRVLRDERLVCEPVRESRVKDGLSDQLCKAWEELVPTEGGRVKCVTSPMFSLSCSPSEVLVDRDGRQRCEPREDRTFCPPGQEIVELPDHGEGHGQNLFLCRYPDERDRGRADMSVEVAVEKILATDGFSSSSPKGSTSHNVDGGDNDVGGDDGAIGGEVNGDDVKRKSGTSVPLTSSSEPDARQSVKVDSTTGSQVQRPVKKTGKRVMSALKQKVSRTVTPTNTATEGELRLISRAPKLVCPEGQRVVSTSVGSICVPKSQPVSTAFEYPEPLRKVPGEGGTTKPFREQRTTQSGDLTPKLHPRLEVPATTKPVLTFGTALTTETDLESALPLCPAGQTVINTPEGKRCGFKSEVWLGAQSIPECGALQLLVRSPQGSKCVNIENVQEDYNPCPPGQKLTKMEDRLECAYFDDVIVDIKPDAYGRCVGKGEMLVQTLAGFFCLRVKEAELGLPTCPKGEVFVKTNMGFECISKDFALLNCGDSFSLQRDTSGFRCSEKPEDLPDPPLPSTPPIEVCRQGEVLIIDGGVHFCRRLEHNSHLCGAGFRPKPTALDGNFVCAEERKNTLACPEGYYRSDSGAECMPVTPHADLCKDPQFQELFGRQVDCTSGNLSAILVPCEEGYVLDQSIEGASNDPKCRLVDFVNVVCEDDKPCRTKQPRKSCDDDVTGGSPCLALLRKVRSGCQPQCANGGSCHGNVCVCPQGLTGQACEHDVDECQDLRDGHCQHVCVNTFGSFHCHCPFGSTLNSDRRSCKTIDCIPDCLNGGVCEDGLCRCPQGLQGDRCQKDIDECRVEIHGCQGYCRNTFGSFECICSPGFQLEDDGRRCLPKNDSCRIRCRNGGRCAKRHCVCPAGFYGVACQLDVNECRGGNHGCSHKCANIRGRYRCLCPPNMALLPDRKTCRKIIRS